MADYKSPLQQLEEDRVKQQAVEHARSLVARGLAESYTIGADGWPSIALHRAVEHITIESKLTYRSLEDGGS